MFFIDTADHLAKVARETLVTARLVVVIQIMFQYMLIQSLLHKMD